MLKKGQTRSTVYALFILISIILLLYILYKIINLKVGGIFVGI